MSDQDELPALKIDGLPRATVEKLELIVRLLQEMTSIQVVSEFLKSKGLAHSAGSWQDIRDKRIGPYLTSQKISIQDLIKLLGEAEEFGRTHVFLFTAKKTDAEACMDETKIRNLAQRHGVTNALSETLVLDLPEKPTLVAIRHETENNQARMVLKLIESREERELVDTRTEGRRIIKEWEIKNIRAVNVARLHSSGLLEIRIQSHLNSTKYEEDLNKIRMALKDFLPPNVFSPFSLAKAKAHLWESRETLKKKIRFSDSTMSNSFGTTLVASTGAEEADLFNDKGATGSIDHFLGHGAHVDSSNIWWLPVDGVCDREIHMLLSGLNNEFAITANCTKIEYEYVLNELRVHSK